MIYNVNEVRQRKLSKRIDRSDTIQSMGFYFSITSEKHVPQTNQGQKIKGNYNQHFRNNKKK